MADINSIPEEILEKIVVHLSVISELQEASWVCREWRKLCFSIYIAKTETFCNESSKGNFIWRLCGDPKSSRPLRLRAKRFQYPRHDINSLIVVPAPRTVPQGSIFRNSLFIFGGEQSSRTSISKGLFNDLHSYDILTGEWAKVQPVPESGIPPRPRCAFSMCRFEDNLIVTGGNTGYSPRINSMTFILYDEIIAYNITGNFWYSIGSLKFARCYHRSACLRSGSGVKLVLTAGLYSGFTMADTVEVVHLTHEDGQLKSASSVSLFTFPHVRNLHSQVQLDPTRLLVYGGYNMDPERPGIMNGFVIRTDAWILEFNEDYTEMIMSSVSVENLDAYNGLYPASVLGEVKVKDCLIYLEHGAYIRRSVTSPEYYETHSDRKPSGEEIYRQDYYHTFILDIGNAISQKCISWRPVKQNPPRFSPRFSQGHCSVRAGDCILVFGGSIIDRRTKQKIETNDLYKVNVLKSLVI